MVRSREASLRQQDRRGGELLTVGAGEVSRDREAYIDAAWRRCVEQYRLDPHSKPRAEHIGDVALQHRREALSLFQRVGRAEMRRLQDQISQQIVQPRLSTPRFALMLVDERATVLETLSDPTMEAYAAECDMRPGFVWDEAHAGSNGPGTCVHDGRARLIHREEHFFRCNRTMSCSAAPIWGADGGLLGALDISFFDCHDSRQGQVMTGTLVSLSARIIEQLHFTQQHADALVMHIHEHPEFIGLPYGSLAAIGEDGRILAVDGSLPNRLGYSSRAALVGRSAADLFDVSLDRLFEHAQTMPMQAWPVGYGNGHAFASLRPPRRREARPAGRRALGDRSPKAARVQDRPQSASLYALAGEDPVMLRNVWRAEHVMDRDIHLLLLGETGTGKDTFARAIHAASERRDKPFVVMSCAAIPESLIESELFGYEAGAFTGARSGGARGKALAANHGTLFLDEIGDMPLTIQARLLRLLEEKEVVPLGTSTPVAVDIRVISATNKDLEAMVESGQFRMDLFYRLNGVALTLPALRARADRSALIERVARRENGGVPIEISPDTKQVLLSYNWPGNIRELRNALRTAIAFADDGPVELVHLPGAVTRGARVEPRAPSADGEGANPAEHAQILSELERQHWRITSTAAALGISRNTLYRKLHRYGLLPPIKHEP